MSVHTVKHSHVALRVAYQSLVGGTSYVSIFDATYFAQKEALEARLN